MYPEKTYVWRFSPPDFNICAHDWIIKPRRNLLGLMINIGLLNTQT